MEGFLYKKQESGNSFHGKVGMIKGKRVKENSEGSGKRGQDPAGKTG